MGQVDEDSDYELNCQARTYLIDNNKLVRHTQRTTTITIICQPPGMRNCGGHPNGMHAAASLVAREAELAT